MSGTVFRAQNQVGNSVAAFAQSNFKLLVGVGLGLLFLFALLSPRIQGPERWSTPVRRNNLKRRAEEEKSLVERPNQGQELSKEQIDAGEGNVNLTDDGKLGSGEDNTAEPNVDGDSNIEGEKIEPGVNGDRNEEGENTEPGVNEGPDSGDGNVQPKVDGGPDAEDGNVQPKVDGGINAGVTNTESNVDQGPNVGEGNTASSVDEGLGDGQGNTQPAVPDSEQEGQSNAPDSTVKVESGAKSVPDSSKANEPLETTESRENEIPAVAENVTSESTVDEGKGEPGQDAAQSEETQTLESGEEGSPSGDGDPAEVPKLLAGFSEAELIFAQQERGRTQCLTAIQRRIRDDYRPLFSGRSKIALVDVALHENLGDDILWRGPIKLAADLGQSIDYICVNSQRSWKGAAKTFPACSVEKTAKVVKGGGLVMFHGGGNWGDLYRFVQTKRLTFLEKLTEAVKGQNVTVLSLPQSIHYKPGSPYLGNDDARLNKLPKNYFTLFLRQKDSYEIAKRHYKTIDAKLSPDIAFILGPMRPIGQPKYDILVLVRQDGEIRPEDKKIANTVAEKAKAANVTHRLQDWWYKPHPGEFSVATVGAFSEVRTAEAIKIVSQGKIVITNRLHATIVATMLGKTLFWVDTVQKKVSNTRSVAFSTSEHCTPENLHATQTATIVEAVDQAIQLLKQKEFIHN